MNGLEVGVLECYSQGEPLANAVLYEKNGGDHSAVKPVGRAKVPRNLFHRKLRWAQQSLKHKGLLERVGRGQWVITGKGKTQLKKIECDSGLIAFSTELGVAIWGDAKIMMKQWIDEPIHLCFTSPPYPLKAQRAYGQQWEAEQEYIDFLCGVLEPIVEKLVAGGSLVLNVSNDIFESGSPSRSLYLERLVLALHDRLGLSLMDRHVWQSNKAPSPLIWSSKRRWQLNAQYEPVLWFCNDPLNTLASIDRVLEPHTEKHLKYVRSGGVRQEVKYGDGAYHKRKGDFSRETKGRIPHNAYYLSNYCHSGRKVNQYAKELDLPPHGAKMPRRLADFYVRYLTSPGQTVVDPFAGTLTTAEAAEKAGRQWLAFDTVWEYLRQSFCRFDDIWVNPSFLRSIKEPVLV